MVPILRWALLLSIGCLAYDIYVWPTITDIETKWSIVVGSVFLAIILPCIGYVSIAYSNEALNITYLCMHGIVGASAFMCWLTHLLIIHTWHMVLRDFVDLIFCLWIVVCSMGTVWQTNEHSASTKTVQGNFKVMPSTQTPKKSTIKVTRTPPKHTKRVAKHAEDIKKRVRRVLKQSKDVQRAKVAKRRAIPSFSHPGKKIYQVTEYSCTCPDYKYRRQGKGEKCKHMKALFEEMSKAPVTTHNE